MRGWLTAPLVLIAWSGVHAVQAQTPDDITRLIERLVELDSIDLAKNVKFRPGILPSLDQVDADESEMKPLKNPFEVLGRNEPGAGGWYRVRITMPEKLGKFPVPPGGFNLGVESNCVGSWEIYTYVNGKPVGSAAFPGAPNSHYLGAGVVGNTRQPPTAWMSNAPLFSKPGDVITLAILATSSPLGRGSPEGYGLRILRLRFALGHTFARQLFFGGVSIPAGPSAQGVTGSPAVPATGLHGAREMLSKLKGDELQKLQEKLKGPLARIDAVFNSAESGKLDDLTNAMRSAAKEINDALKK